MIRLGSLLSVSWLTGCRPEFRTFVEHTEKELYTLFQSIDRDHDGRLDKNELKSAFRKAGLSVPSSKLDRFFDEVDMNNDVSGVLSWMQPCLQFTGLHNF